MTVSNRLGRYEIVDELAHGAHGIVYRALDVELDRVVALKVARADASPVALVRFRREACLAARLRHPDIVDVLDWGEEGGRPYFAMPLLEGGSLTAAIYGGSLDASGTARLLERVARAVHFAHERGVVHRDLKPTNILLREDGTPAVTDFGVAREGPPNPGLTHAGELLGTPCYMSPEQIAGRTAEIDARSDVYALGAILYEMLARRPPFSAPSFADLSSRVLNDEPELPSRVVAAVDPSLEAIAIRCLRKDPAERYPSASLLADDLGCVARGERLLLPPAVAPLHSPAGGRRLLLALVVVCAAATVLTLTSAALVGRRDAPPAYARLESEPSGASVTVEGLRLGTTPLDVPVAAEVDLSLAGRVSARLRMPQSGRIVHLPRPDEVPSGMVYDAGQELFADRIEVTVEEYGRFVVSTAHRAPPTWKRSTAPQSALADPVSGVSWSDAEAFAAWAGRRLPTASEWRGLSACDALGDGVREWTASAGAAGEEWRVVCGGSFERPEHERVPWIIEERRADTRARDLGFRCVLDPPWRRR